MISTLDTLPLSLFEPRPFAEHEPGTLLILPAWRKEPGLICLGIRIGGLIEGGAEVPAALIVQGAYGGEVDDVGMLLPDGHVREQSVLGLNARVGVDIVAGVRADTTGQRGVRVALGMLALGAFGVRVIGGARSQGRLGWAVGINPATWLVDNAIDGGAITALIDTWCVVISGLGHNERCIQVRAPSLESFR